MHSPLRFCFESWVGLNVANAFLLFRKMHSHDSLDSKPTVWRHCVLALRLRVLRAEAAKIAIAILHCLFGKSHMMVSNIFYVHHYLERIPSLTSIFFWKGWVQPPTIDLYTRPSKLTENSPWMIFLFRRFFRSHRRASQDEELFVWFLLRPL